MRKLLLSITLCLGLTSGFATIHTVTTSGFTFTPATVNAFVGDTVAIGITSGIHNATEVSSSTWTANGTTPLSGGFAFSFPGGMVICTSPGTRYYVCTNHVMTSMMKGQINISPVGVDENEDDFSISLYPNPVNEILNLNINGSSDQAMELEIINLLGTKVLDLGGKQVLPNGIRKVDVSALPKGVYFLNIVGDNRTKSIRFVKR